jgi:hypothetical protein
VSVGKLTHSVEMEKYIYYIPFTLYSFRINRIFLNKQKNFRTNSTKITKFKKAGSRALLTNYPPSSSTLLVRMQERHIGKVIFHDRVGPERVLSSFWPQPAITPIWHGK